MRNIRLIIAIAMCVFTGAINAENNKADYNVVPLPEVINTVKGKPFVLNPSSVIVFSGDKMMKRNAGFLSEYVEKAVGMRLDVAEKTSKNAIILRLNKKIKGDEEYMITVNEKNVLIEGRTPNGVFYGIQTLRKSLPTVKNALQIELPAVTISDKPRFGYRGMHLDVSRHFFTVEFVKEYIDLLALHNMNKFHWHLTDDQGWRLEIKKYPKLTQISAFRTGTVVGRNSGVYDDVRYGGFYTQEQARDIVEYARQRYITVIPEIDMPGHMLAVLKAYPEFGCTGGPYEVGRSWGVFDDILCAGNDDVFSFVNDVLDEVMQIFPSKYIHIGGDEAPRVRWEKCPKCQKRISELGLKKDEHASAEARLQVYFASRVEKYLNEHGRSIIGWDEILEGDIAQSATIMSWRGMEGGLKASKLGHDVIMTPVDFAYFDYYQTPSDERKYIWNEPLLIGGKVPLEKVYSFEPAPKELGEEAQKHILGAQANLWTEYIYCENLAEYQVLPRMAALCEVQWMKPENKNYDNFKLRLPRLTDIYKMYGLTVAPYAK